MSGDDAWRRLPDPDPERGKRDWLYYVITWGVGAAVPLATIVGLALLVMISTRQQPRPPDPSGRRFHAIAPQSAREHECWSDGVRAVSAEPCPPGSLRREFPAENTESHAPPSIQLSDSAKAR